MLVCVCARLHRAHVHVQEAETGHTQWLAVAGGDWRWLAVTGGPGAISRIWLPLFDVAHDRQRLMQKGWCHFGHPPGTGSLGTFFLDPVQSPALDAPWGRLPSHFFPAAKSSPGTQGWLLIEPTPGSEDAPGMASRATASWLAHWSVLSPVPAPAQGGSGRSKELGTKPEDKKLVRVSVLTCVCACVCLGGHRAWTRR